MMNNLIKINFQNNRPTVLGRDLHEAFQVETRYNDWFKRMREYGFSEGIDFYSILSKTSNKTIDFLCTQVYNIRVHKK